MATIVKNRIDYLPNEVETYGSGGGKAVKITNGSYTGYYVGGGKREDVLGNTYHPSTPYSKNPETLPWAFIPIADHFGIDRLGPDLRGYYQNLPQDAFRLGGDLMEWKMTPFVNSTLLPNPNSTLNGGSMLLPTRPFYLIADQYSGNQTIYWIRYCGLAHRFNITIDRPIQFNSTGNIQPGSVVQYYRGDSVAVTLQGYDNTKGLSDNKTLVPNPPFPGDAWRPMWYCINTTTKNSIPLMKGGPPLTGAQFGGVLGGVLGFVTLLMIWGCSYINNRIKKAKGSDDIELKGSYSKVLER